MLRPCSRTEVWYYSYCYC